MSNEFDKIKSIFVGQAKEPAKQGTAKPDDTPDQLLKTEATKWLGVFLSKYDKFCQGIFVAIKNISFSYLFPSMRSVKLFFFSLGLTVINVLGYLVGFHFLHLAGCLAANAFLGALSTIYIIKERSDYGKSTLHSNTSSSPIGFSRTREEYTEDDVQP